MYPCWLSKFDSNKYDTYIFNRIRGKVLPFTECFSDFCQGDLNLSIKWHLYNTMFLTSLAADSLIIC